MQGSAQNTEIDGSSDQKKIVLGTSSSIADDAICIKGYEFSLGNPVDYSALFKSFKSTGFQASNLALAIEEVDKMIQWKSTDPEYPDAKCKIFLGYTSNMVSSGVREIIKFLVKNKLVDVIVSSAGGIEEDFIKCLAPMYLGDFHTSGKELRMKGHNRIGNLIMPNKNYCAFEDWLMPILDRIMDERERDPSQNWTPSKLINRLGKEIHNEESIYYWAQKHNIPVFCPGLTDGSLGDMLYFYSYKRSGFTLDIVEDLRLINSEAVFAKCTGMIILGGGIIKHHICNANLMRNGADFSVYINTGIEYDGSDAGASPDEAVSWGKIKLNATPVKVYGEASMLFPILVAETFAKINLTTN